jgi:hypothetical protein
VAKLSAPAAEAPGRAFFGPFDVLLWYQICYNFAFKVWQLPPVPHPFSVPGANDELMDMSRNNVNLPAPSQAQTSIYQAQIGRPNCLLGRDPSTMRNARGAAGVGWEGSFISC